MYKNPVNEEHPHEQPGEKVDEHGDKQHDVQVNEGPGEQVNGQVDEQVDEHVDKQLGQHIDGQANDQGNKQPDHEAKDSVSTSKETAHGGHATIPDVAINGNNETGSKKCPLNGLLPEVYDCKHDTRHCFACSRPRDMRSNKRTLTDIKKFHWCAQCGTIRSQPFHEHYPSGTEVPPRHQLCHPCCNLAKLPPKSGSSTYNPPKVDDDASNNSKKRASGDEKGQARNSLTSDQLMIVLKMAQLWSNPCLQTSQLRKRIPRNLRHLSLALIQVISIIPRSLMPWPKLWRHEPLLKAHLKLKPRGLSLILHLASKILLVA
ncbi:hypothetical protein N0V85_001417 [Neurospora sp. IMI 360204]|nr:hypothetical protein N0V85_001417 [Neurospora sp. IMI 360204]